MTAFDERGDLKEVDLLADGQLIQRTDRSYPFQFRYTPPASAVGIAGQADRRAVDSAGNRPRRDLYVNVLAGDTRPIAGGGRAADAARDAARR